MENPKFRIGDQVWYLADSKVATCKITGVFFGQKYRQKYDEKPDKKEWFYNIENCLEWASTWKLEADLFPSLQALKDSLTA